MNEHTTENDAVHWGGVDSRPTSLHGNGAASFERVTLDWSGVTCRLCWSLRRDPAPETIGSPYHHEDERECFYRADGSGWWPWRFEDGIENRSGGTICFREHTDPTRVLPPGEATP